MPDPYLDRGLLDPAGAGAGPAPPPGTAIPDTINGVPTRPIPSPPPPWWLHPRRPMSPIDPYGPSPAQPGYSSSGLPIIAGPGTLPTLDRATAIPPPAPSPLDGILSSHPQFAWPGSSNLPDALPNARPWRVDPRFEGPRTTAAPTPRAIGSDANFPVMGASGFPGTYAAPGRQPPVPASPTATTGVFNNPADSPVRAPTPPPRPAIDPRRVDLGYYQNPRFTTIDRPNAPAAGNARGGGGPLTMGALDLSGLFKRGQS